MRRVDADFVLPGGILEKGTVTVGEDGKIEEIGSQRAAQRRSDDLDATGFLILPGFIDMHVHGGGGADFMDGTLEAAQSVAATHARFGATSLLATTLSASSSETEQAIRAIRAAMEAPRPAECARLIGIHLEGPYLCSLRRGAQPERHLRPPDMREFDRWRELSGNNIRQITLAPELPGAELLIREASAAGVVVSLGHSDAAADQALAAASWGATQATHLFNAMPPLHHRAPGLAGAALTCPKIRAEIIADGEHLDPLIVRLAFAAKGPAGMILITDAMAGAGMPEGTYALGGRPVQVKNGRAQFDDGVLAGSVLTMNRAWRNACDFTGCTLADSVRLSSANAAAQLRMSETIGALEIGKSADMVALDPETGVVEWTMIDGQIAYRR